MRRAYLGAEEAVGGFLDDELAASGGLGCQDAMALGERAARRRATPYR